MYSVVLTAALLVGSGATDCNWGGGRGGGCCGCFGGGYGGGGYYGGGGGCYGYGGGGYGGHGGHGYASMGYGGGYYGYAAMPMYGQPIVAANTTDPNRGTLIVNLPENAKLTVDGTPTQQTASQRQFVTPPIQPGQEFTYTLVAETTQNGQPVSQTQRVTVRPGQQQPVTFNFSTTPAETNR